MFQGKMTTILNQIATDQFGRLIVHDTENDQPVKYKLNTLFD
jgi:hypothetical protein